MRRVHIVVEGRKDVYFLHELIMQRFHALFSRANNVISVHAKKNWKNPCPMTGTAGALDVKIFEVSGFDRVNSYRDHLKRPKSLAPTDEFCSAVVFDADIAPVPPAANPNKAGIAARPGHILDLLDITDPAKRVTAAKQVFLFPDNQSDGDLEMLMERGIIQTSAHQDFLQVCWQNFERCVAHHGFNAVTRKSRMNEFTAAFDSLAWEDNGINRCFARPNLWDWPSQAFDDLSAFLDGLFTGVTPTSFSGCL